MISPTHLINLARLFGAINMWVYQKTESDLWTVGFFSPNGTWYTDIDCDSQDNAAARVNYLNGGVNESTLQEIRNAILETVGSR